MSVRREPDLRPKRFALLIGVMKSGTTSFFDTLTRHPEICASAQKEPGYFRVRDARSEADAVLKDQRYLDLWRAWDPARHKVAFEASTGYSRRYREIEGLDMPGRVERFIESHGADLRFMYLMRDPLERLESHMRYIAQHRPRKLFIGRKEFVDYALETSCYATQLAPWVERFGRDRFLLLAMEEMNDGAFWRRICEFLEVDPEHRFEGIEKVRNVSVRVSPAMSLFTRSAQARRVWQRVPEPWRTRLRERLEKLGESRRPLLREHERREALRRFESELRRLRDDYEFETSSWTVGR